MNLEFNTMRLELLDFSEKIEQEFDFGDEKRISLLSFLMRLFTW